MSQQEKTLLLIGNPNVGNSLLFGCLITRLVDLPLGGAGSVVFMPRAAWRA